MAQKEGRAQRAAIIVIMLLFVFTSVGAVVLSVMQNNDQTEQQKALQELLKQQNQTQDQPAQKKAENAYIPKGEVKKLQITDLKTGSGAEVKEGDTITAHYQGTLSDGTIFDSSYDRGEPSTFSLGQVIEGWQEGIPGMKVGGKRRLVIPASLGYGESGTQGIPPNSVLVFEIELKSIGGGQ